MSSQSITGTNTSDSFYISTATPIYTTSTMNIIPPNGYYYYNSNDMTTYTMKDLVIKDKNEFTDIKEYVPGKVYSFTFADETKIKTVCSDEDVFNLEYAFYLALSKKLFSKELTFEGILRMVEEIRCQKYYVNLVKKGMKLFNKLQKTEQEKKEKEEIKAHQHKKYIEKKKKQKERRLKRQAEILAKAINKEGE